MYQNTSIHTNTFTHPYKHACIHVRARAHTHTHRKDTMNTLTSINILDIRSICTIYNFTEHKSVKL